MLLFIFPFFFLSLVRHMPALTTGPHKAAIHYPGFVFSWLQKWIIKPQIKIMKFYSPDCVVLVIYVSLFVTQHTAVKTAWSLQVCLCTQNKGEKISLLQPHYVKIVSLFFFFLHQLRGNFAIQNPISVSLEDFFFFGTTGPWPHKAACPLSGWRLLPCQQWSTVQFNLQTPWACLRTYSHTNMPHPLTGVEAPLGRNRRWGEA